MEDYVDLYTYSEISTFINKLIVVRAIFIMTKYLGMHLI